MGLLFDNNTFKITNAGGETKFALDRQMPHMIIVRKTGTLTLPSILSSDPTAEIINRTDSYTIVTDSRIKTNDYFLLPYYKLTNGVADTGSYYMCGVGSTLIRIIRQPLTGVILGTSLLDVVVEEGSLKVQVRNTFDRSNNINLIASDTAVTLDYSVYYGRFSWLILQI